MDSDNRGNMAIFDQEKRLEIAYLDESGRPVPRGRAMAVRRRVLDSQGHVLKETVRRKIS